MKNRIINIRIQYFEYTNSWMVSVSEGELIEIRGQKFLGLSMGHKFSIILLLKAWWRYRKDKRNKINGPNNSSDSVQ